MRRSVKQFERSTTPENALLTQSICKFCRRIVAATARRKLLPRIEKSHICPEKPQPVRNLQSRPM